MKNKIEVLDCTLRDGGYYNNEFKYFLVKNAPIKYRFHYQFFLWKFPY